MQSELTLGYRDDITLGGPLKTGQRWCDRPGLVSSQDALSLLRTSFSGPKVQHFLHCSPDVVWQIRWLSKVRCVRHHWRGLLCLIVSGSRLLYQSRMAVSEYGELLRSHFLPFGFSVKHSPVAKVGAGPHPCLRQRRRRLTGRDTQVSLGGHLRSSPIAQLAHRQRQSPWDRPGELVACEGWRDLLSFFSTSWSRISSTAQWWLAAHTACPSQRAVSDWMMSVAVALRLGVHLGKAHICRCGANVDPPGLHSLVCRLAPGCAARHHPVNDCIFRALEAVWNPAWFALTASGQTAVLSSHGIVGSPSHVMLRQPVRWRTGPTIPL